MEKYKKSHAKAIGEIFKEGSGITLLTGITVKDIMKVIRSLENKVKLFEKNY